MCACVCVCRFEHGLVAHSAAVSDTSEDRNIDAVVTEIAGASFAVVDELCGVAKATRIGGANGDRPRFPFLHLRTVDYVSTYVQYWFGLDWICLVLSNCVSMYTFLLGTPHFI